MDEIDATRSLTRAKSLARGPVLLHDDDSTSQ